MERYEQQDGPSYLLYLIGGSVVAFHLDEVHDWVCGHAWLIVALTAASALAAEGIYFLALHGVTTVLGSGSDLLQPSVIPFNIGAIACVYLAGVALARPSRSRRAKAAVRVGVDDAFGIYLSQMVFITALIWLGWGRLSSVVPWPLLCAASVAIIFGCCIALTALLARTPLAVPLTGRSGCPGPACRSRGGRAPPRSRQRLTRSQSRLTRSPSRLLRSWLRPPRRRSRPDRSWPRPTYGPKPTCPGLRPPCWRSWPITRTERDVDQAMDRFGGGSLGRRRLPPGCRGSGSADLRRPAAATRAWERCLDRADCRPGPAWPSGWRTRSNMPAPWSPSSARAGWWSRSTRPRPPPHWPQCWTWPGRKPSWPTAAPVFPRVFRCSRHGPGRGRPPGWHRPDPADGGIFLCTSGTSGTPKGVELGDSQLSHVAEASPASTG